MIQGNLFDGPPPELVGPGPAPTAVGARDKALERVATNAGDWMANALDLIRGLPLYWEGTGELLRLRLLRDGLAPPHHHNAWGALVCQALRLHLLHNTGRVGQMVTKKSHARKSPILARDAEANANAKGGS